MTKIKQLKDLEIEYLLSGEKNLETILFLHGLGANLSQFEQQHNYFSKDFKVLSINLRGHGKSILTKDIRPKEFNLITMCNDVIDLLDSLNIDKVHFIGNSMGGNVGYEILKSNSQILKSLITYGTTGQLSTSKITFRIMKFIYEILSPKAIGSLSKFAGQTNESREKIKEMISQANKSALLSILPNIANFNYLDVIKTSNTPCMIIKGEKDKDINKAIEATIIEFENRGNFKLKEISGVGHFVNLDNPVLFNKTVEEYILNINK